MRELSFGALRSVLCLGAHCDDIEIGAGATIRALVSAQPEVRVNWVIFSSTEQRASEARTSAHDFLSGASGVNVQIRTHTDGFFPGEFETIKRSFEELKKIGAPDLIFTHHRDDRHQDHHVISDLTWNTFRDHLVLEYEIPKYDGDLGHPNVFVPIVDEDRQFKIDTLMRHYASQHSKDWFTPETFNALMRIRGVECRSRTGYAEAFHVRKFVVNSRLR